MRALFDKYVFAVLLLSAWTRVQVHATSDTSLLMIGNSFSDANNVEEMIRTMLEQDIEYSNNVYAMRFREGSSRFDDDAKNQVIHSTIAERSWTWVVLQEQSQIPGLYETTAKPEFDKSLAAAAVLNGWINESNSETILLMTWGQRAGDPMNPQTFKDFLTMQDKLQKGYEMMQDKISTPEHPVRVSPAGLAFKEVYKSVIGTPEARGTAFYDLYEEDGKHPSLAGSYLVAATLYGTLSGKDPINIKYKPRELTGTQQAILLRAASKANLLYNRQNTVNRQYWDSRQGRGSGANNSDKKPYVPTDQTDDPPQQGRSSGGSLLLFSGVFLLLGVVGGRRVMTTYQPNKSSRRPVRYQELPVPGDDMELVDVPTAPNPSPLMASA